MKAVLYPWHVFGIVVACSEVLLAEERHHLILFLIHLHLRDKESSVATGIPQLGHRLADQRVGDGLNPTRMPLLAMLSHFA
jgi:hypothetical protein